MAMNKNLRTHKLSAGAVVCVAGTYYQIAPDSPAIEAMTDFARVSAVTIAGAASVNEANGTMIARGVRLLLVASEAGLVTGLITARDTMGEKPMQVVQSRGCHFNELTVADLMTPVEKIDTLTMAEVMGASVVDILNALKAQGRQHILVEDIDPLTGTARVRGIFSATQIGRLLGVPVQGFELARTFAEIESALAN